MRTLPFQVRWLVAGLLAVAAMDADRATAGTVGPYATLDRVHIRQKDLPPPHATPSVGNPPRIVERPPGAQLSLPHGFVVFKAASGLEVPRRMELAPNGDVFVSESGSGKLLIFRDTDGDGRFGAPLVFARGLQRPFGMAFAPGALFVGTDEAILRFDYQPGDARAGADPVVLVRFATGNHWTRDVLYEKGTDRIYVSIGSRSNAREELLPSASVFWFSRNADAPEPKTYASGLRNPVSLAKEPVTGKIWTVVNEMDGLGDELPPDWATGLQEGGFYGWPFAYAGNNLIPDLPEKHRARAKSALRPDVLLRAHSAPLGIAFYDHDAFPDHFRGGAFVALHGSWNASGRRGYEVVYLPFKEGKALGWSERFLSGWSMGAERKEVWGRPVGLLVDKDGSLLVSDDAGGTIWRVRYQVGKDRG